MVASIAQTTTFNSFGADSYAPAWKIDAWRTFDKDAF